MNITVGVRGAVVQNVSGPTLTLSAQFAIEVNLGPSL